MNPRSLNGLRENHDRMCQRVNDMANALLRIAEITKESEVLKIISNQNLLEEKK